jgi:hypothetical protein
MSRLAHPKPDRYAKVVHKIDYTGLAQPKRQPIRDARLRSFVRSRGCQIEGLNGHVCGPRYKGRLVMEFAHIGVLGMAIKSSDELGIGLCHDAHQEQTAINWPAFIRKYHINPKEIARQLNEEYRARHPQKETR